LNKKLFDAGFSVVVLANQTERVKIKAIREALKIIKREGGIFSIEKDLSATLDDMRDLTPVKEAQELERKYCPK
jgi:2-methylisocitrate lyase-like PEP mutase family enzyme